MPNLVGRAGALAGRPGRLVTRRGIDSERRWSIAGRRATFVFVKVMVHSNRSPAKNEGCLGVTETTTDDAYVGSLAAAIVAQRCPVEGGRAAHLHWGPRWSAARRVGACRPPGMSGPSTRANDGAEPSAKRVKVEGKGVPPWKAAAERRAAGPAAPGSKPIPEGRPNCLAGLTLVFTGELSSLGRDDAVDLAKRYGAYVAILTCSKVTTAPSSKTSFVVVGEGAGAKKLETIQKNRLKTLDEDGFLQLIAERGAQKLDERVKDKLAAEEKKVQAAARALETSSAPGQLWTSKYAPKQLKELVGNKSNVEKLQAWLRDWPKSLQANFKKPGPHATNTFRAMLISGAPGIGKTTAVHLVCKLEGYEVLELNASDTRSKRLLESELSQTIHNRSIGDWAKPGTAKLGRLAIVLDEVDGMSGGDRGGIGAINALIRKTQVPIICICNDRRNPKMQPLYSTTFNMTFAKPTVQAIRSRMLSIAFREGLQIPAEVMDQLIAAAQSDLRLVTNMLSTWKLSHKRMSFDEGKKFGAANQKPTLQTPFSLYGELASPQRFGPLNKQSLNDKLDYYFQDHAFVPLMVAENYIKSQPVLAQRESVPALKEWKQLQLLRNASESISDGDLVDTLMNGPQQHWSLMPLHGIASSVRPCSYIYGGHSSFPAFPSYVVCTHSASWAKTPSACVCSANSWTCRPACVLALQARKTTCASRTCQVCSRCSWIQFCRRVRRPSQASSILWTSTTSCPRTVRRSWSSSWATCGARTGSRRCQRPLNRLSRAPTMLAASTYPALTPVRWHS